jgi:hypothetical protein
MTHVTVPSVSRPKLCFWLCAVNYVINMAWPSTVDMFFRSLFFCVPVTVPPSHFVISEQVCWKSFFQRGWVLIDSIEMQAIPPTYGCASLLIKPEIAGLSWNLFPLSIISKPVQIHTSNDAAIHYDHPKSHLLLHAFQNSRLVSGIADMSLLSFYWCLASTDT